MRPVTSLIAMVSFSLVLAGVEVVHATADSDTGGMWECPQENGVPLYTNKERPDCRPMTLKPLSIVPSIVGLPVPLNMVGVPAPHQEFPPVLERHEAKNIPDWGKDWYANNTSVASVQGEICSLYAEWIRLNERSRGGFFFGTDPSYGSDPTALSFRQPSQSYYDNTRWVTLNRIFGAGFVPIGCP